MCRHSNLCQKPRASRASTSLKCFHAPPPVSIVLPRALTRHLCKSRPHVLEQFADIIADVILPRQPLLLTSFTYVIRQLTC